MVIPQINLACMADVQVEDTDEWTGLGAVRAEPHE